jgi:hypothetical protein
MPYVYVGTDVLEEFDDDDLIFELKSRNIVTHQGDDEFETKEIIRKIYEKRRIGEDYQQELDALIYDVLGRVV